MDYEQHCRSGLGEALLAISIALLSTNILLQIASSPGWLAEYFLCNTLLFVFLTLFCCGFLWWLCRFRRPSMSRTSYGWRLVLVGWTSIVSLSLLALITFDLELFSSQRDVSSDLALVQVVSLLVGAVHTFGILPIVANLLVTLVRPPCR